MSASITNSGYLYGSVTLTGGYYLDNTGTIVSNVSPGVYGRSSPNTVANSGTISGSQGVYLVAGGSVVNAQGGLITGSTNGVHVKGSAGYVVNAATIANTGSYGSGVRLDQFGMVTNGGNGISSALLVGYYGVQCIPPARWSTMA